MMKAKSLGIFIFGLFLIGLVSANGLSVISNETVVVNKTYNQDIYVEIAIKNNEPWDFFNVTLEENPYITMTKIPKISSGETKNITLLVTSQEDITDTFKLYGFYLASLGAQNITHTVDLTRSDGPSECMFSIVRGDSIIWRNLETSSYDKIQLVNSQTGDIFHELQPQSNVTIKYDSPIVIPFHTINALGSPSPYCELTVLDDNGYINNPEMDASLNININALYPPTSIELFILNREYSMKFHETKEDIFSIKNIGNETAKNIHLSGDWFIFTSNDFDILPGESKNIGYTIKPRIKYSNETDKTHTKSFDITGNFPTITSEFEIFIEYAEFVNSENASIESFKDYICENFPEFCEPQVVYKYIEDGEREVNYTTTEDRIDRLYSIVFDYMDENEIKTKQDIELKSEISEDLISINSSTSGTDMRLTNIEKKIEDQSNSFFFTAWIIGMVVCSIILFILILKYRDRFKNNMWSKY